MTGAPTPTRRGALALAGAITLSGCSALTTSGCSLEPATSIGNAWPMARRGPTRAAAAPAAIAPDSTSDLEEQWTFRVPRDATVPVVRDGLACTVASDTDAARSGDATPPTLVALDITDGTVRWEASLDEATFRLPMVSGPVVANETVYVTVGPGWPGTEDINGHLYALEAATGNVSWTYARPQIASSSLVARGLVFLRHEKALLAVEADTGEPCWRYDPGGNLLQRQFSGAALSSVPALADGTLYARVLEYDSSAGPDDRRYRFDAIDAASGNRRWRTDWFHVANAGTSPVVTDDLVVFATDNVVRGFGLRNGEQHWRVPVVDSKRYPDVWVPSVAATSETVCALLLGGARESVHGYYAIDRKRRDIRWHRPGYRAPPIIAGETVYGSNVAETDADGNRVPRLRGIDIETGDARTITRFEPGDRLPVSPTIAAGQLFSVTSKHEGESTDSDTVSRIHSFA